MSAKTGAGGSAARTGSRAVSSSIADSVSSALSIASAFGSASSCDFASFVLANGSLAQKLSTLIRGGGASCSNENSVVSSCSPSTRGCFPSAAAALRRLFASSYAITSMECSSVASDAATVSSISLCSNISTTRRSSSARSCGAGSESASSVRSGEIIGAAVQGPSKPTSTCEGAAAAGFAATSVPAAALPPASGAGGDEPGGVNSCAARRRLSSSGPVTPSPDSGAAKKTAARRCGVGAWEGLSSCLPSALLGRGGARDWAPAYEVIN